MIVEDMSVELIDTLGTDLSVVNAARVSMAKESDWEVKAGFRKEDTGVLTEKDQKLLKYLATHNHWTPFSHPQLSFRIKAPIFVARQWFKHMIGFTRNETSRRYVDEEPTFYFPQKWRKRAENVKQGSSEEAVSLDPLLKMEDGSGCIFLPEEIVNSSLSTYLSMIELGVAPEQARMILPQNMMTEWVETASLAGVARACKLRMDSHAQSETRDLADKVASFCKDKFPYSWKYLT